MDRTVDWSTEKWHVESVELIMLHCILDILQLGSNKKVVHLQSVCSFFLRPDSRWAEMVSRRWSVRETKSLVHAFCFHPWTSTKCSNNQITLINEWNIILMISLDEQFLMEKFLVFTFHPFSKKSISWVRQGPFNSPVPNLKLSKYVGEE